MDEKPATYRYVRRLGLTMLFFFAASLALAWLDRNTEMPKGMLAALAAIPIAALLSTFWIQSRFLRDLDEYLRQIHVKALLFGAAVALGLGTGWGYLESYVDAPALPVFWLNPVFWIAYSVGVITISLRERVGQQ